MIFFKDGLELEKMLTNLAMALDLSPVIIIGFVNHPLTPGQMGLMLS
jgi:hypothetical protein